MLRCLHLSDIHFGQERDHGTLKIHDDVRDELLKDVERFGQTLGPVHQVLVCGDIAFAGKKEQYDTAGTWLDALTDAAKCGRTDVRTVPGNHDVDRDRIGMWGKTAHETLRTCDLRAIDANLEGFTKDSSGINPLFAKFSDYRVFASRYGCDFDSIVAPYWRKPLLTGASNQLQLVGLNSAQISDKDEAQGKLLLGNAQYVGALARNDGTESVVMLHHPVHWFRDQVQVKQYLYSRARVIILGHEHLQSITKNTSEGDHETLVIHSGAVNPDEIGGSYVFTYNWLEFRFLERDEKALLSVTVHPRIWIAGRTEFAADTNRLGGGASKEFLIACPRAAAEQRAKASHAPAALPKTPELRIANGAHDGAVRPAVVSEPLAMDNTDEAGFAQLRYFFWKFLDWRVRLQVLIELDLLPKTADQPVSQVLERLALDNARDQHKLELLWEAVMKQIPEKERLPNPFARARA